VSGDVWDPGQYERFAAERRQPFVDLLALVEPVPRGRVVDLGCGTGELTAELHRHTGARETLGIDSSSAMLEQAASRVGDGLRFERSDISAFPATNGRWDVIFANASLHWLPDHPALLARLANVLAPGGQVAVQVPANDDHPSHTLARELGAEMGVEPAARAGAVLTPEAYAELLHELGFDAQHVRLQVYGHVLDTSTDVVEWTSGTLLTEYRRALDAVAYERFVAEYRRRLQKALGDRRPYFYAFRRILLWARAPSGSEPR
jgi:trans-aconitate 2-methyltransferase